MTAKLKPFVISRVLDAPRDRVWQAWTEVERMEQWFSPKGFTRIAAKMDFRVGGTYHYGMRASNGQEMWGRFVYREIKKPERMVWINSFSDKDGGLTVHPMNPNWPRAMLTTVSFKELGGKTEVTIEWIPVEGSTDIERNTFDQGRQSMTTGWTGTLDQITAYLNKS